MKRTAKSRIHRAQFHRRFRASVFIAAVLASAIAVTCVRGVFQPGTLASITVTPNATMAAGSTQQMTAVGYDAGEHVVSISPTWSIAAGGGAISPTGLFIAGTVTGSFANTVVASVGSISGSASITVTPGALASLTITPSSVTLAVSSTQQFVAVGTDAGGNIVPIAATWSVVAGGGAVDAAGLFAAGVTAGTFTNTVRATSGTISGFATVVVTGGSLASITVTPNSDTLVAGARRQFVAIGKDANGNTVPVDATWSVAAGGGLIDQKGLFTAGTTAGTFANTVKVTSGALSGTATVVVTCGTLAIITVTPSFAMVAASGTQQFIAVGTDVGGNAVPVTPVWSLVAGGGSIDADGLFTAGTTAGTFARTVKATSGALSGTATVVVTHGSLASVAVTPSAATLPIKGAQQFTAVGSDANGNAVSIAATWSVVAGGGAIDGAGLFTAGTTAGTYSSTVKATSGGISGFATVVVTAGSLTTVTVTPNAATLPISGTQQFTATGRDANGNVVAITSVWTVVANGGTIDGTGLFTAGTTAGTFANTVKATGGTLAGTATVNITAGPLASITVTPNPATLNVTDQQQFIAVGTDVGGNTVPITPLWSVVAGGGSIDAAGLFTAGATPGTYANTVRAASGTLSGTATVISVPLPGFTTTFEDFSPGGIDQQHDWKSLGGLGAPPPVDPLDTHCRVYDHEIADNTAAMAGYNYPPFARISLRISNAVVYGCYADQTFSNRTPNFAGQAGAWSTSANGLKEYALRGGVLQNHFEAEWSFASTVPGAQQPGLAVVASPARGDDSRMSWVQMADLPDGLAIVFAERSNPALPGAFQLSTVAHGLDRRVPHTIKISMDFMDGPDNDVVRVFVDGALTHTGTSWENYYYYDANGRKNFGGNPPVVNRIMFRTGSDASGAIPGGPAPATLGHGFVFDNLRQATYMIATPPSVRSDNR